jgi:uncharacterized short protein YbdD (DUF466 family)
MSQLVVFVASAARAVRAMLGVPDYERYVEHCRSHHPDSLLMTRDQYATDLLERKYSRPGTRCC